MANLTDKEQVKNYIKTNGRWPAGWVPCMDCRCTGKGECAGETRKQQNDWYDTMNEELGGNR